MRVSQTKVQRYSVHLTCLSLFQWTLPWINLHLFIRFSLCLLSYTQTCPADVKCQGAGSFLTNEHSIKIVFYHWKPMSLMPPFQFHIHVDSLNVHNNYQKSELLGWLAQKMCFHKHRRIKRCSLNYKFDSRKRINKRKISFCTIKRDSKQRLIIMQCAVVYVSRI